MHYGWCVYQFIAWHSREQVDDLSVMQTSARMPHVPHLGSVAYVNCQASQVVRWLWSCCSHAAVRTRSAGTTPCPHHQLRTLQMALCAAQLRFWHSREQAHTVSQPWQRHRSPSLPRVAHVSAIVAPAACEVWARAASASPPQLPRSCWQAADAAGCTRADKEAQAATERR